MSTLLSIGGMVSTVSVNAAPFAAGMLAVMRNADQTRDHILANNAAIGTSYAALQQKVGVDVFKPLTTSAQAAQRNVKAAVDQTAADAARAAAQIERLSKIQVGGIQRPARPQMPDMPASGGINFTASAASAQVYTQSIEQVSAATRALNSALDPAEQHEQRLQLLRATHAERVTQLTASLAQLQRATAAEGQTEEQRTALLKRTQQTEVELAREETALARTRTQAADQVGSGVLRGLLTGVGGQVLGGLGLAGGVSVLTSQMVNLGRESTDLALKADTIGTAYDAATHRAGLGADDLLKKLQDASRGTVADADLMTSANKAMALGVGQNTQQVADLLSIARQKGKDFGEDTSQAFNDIVTGLGRLSPRILDNLGIILDENQIYIEYAKSIGVATGKLSDQEKRQALVNELLRTNSDLVAKNAQAQVSAADQVAQAQAQLQTAKTQLGQDILPVELSLIKDLSALIKSLPGAIPQDVDRINAQLEKSASSYEDYVNRVNAAARKLNPSGVLGHETTVDERTGNQLQQSIVSRDQFALDAQADAHQRDALAATANAVALQKATDATLAHASAADIDTAKTQLEAAKTNYADFANAQITGTKVYGDALSDLQIQQSNATLAQLEFTKAGGGLSKVLDPIQRQIDQETLAVGEWTGNVKDATEAVQRQQDVLAAVTEEQKGYDQAVSDAKTNLDQQQSRLDALTNVYDTLGRSIEDAKRKMDDLRRTPLVGESSLDDKLFAMDQAVKRQQLLIDRAKDQGAGKDTLKALNDQMDRLQRAEDEARLAGSLKYDSEHRALEQQGIDRKGQEKTVQDASAAIAEQQAAIDKDTAAQQQLAPTIADVKKIVDDAKWSLLDATGAQRLHNEQVTEAKTKLDLLNASLDADNKTLAIHTKNLSDQQKAYTDAKDLALKPYADQIDAIDTKIKTLELTHVKNFGAIEHMIDDYKNKKLELAPDDIIAGLTTWGQAVDALALKYQALMSQANATNVIGSNAFPGAKAPFSGGTGQGPDVNAINQILEKTGLAGMGSTIAKLAQQYNVPAELALAMFRKESSYGTFGSSVGNRNPGNLRGSPLESGERSGFAVFPDLQTGIEAYFKLLSESYRQFIDKGDIAGLVNKYAPPSENNTALYIQQITAWMDELTKALHTAATGQGPLAAGEAALGIPGSQVTTQFSAAHQGIDLAGADEGTPIHALQGGKVILSAWNDMYGNMVEVANAQSGKIEEYYGHLAERLVKVGDLVSAGTVIGTLGGTGSSATGVHLHLQMYDENGQIIDPMAALAKMFGTGQGPTEADLQTLMAYLTAMGQVNTAIKDTGPNLPVLAGQIAGIGAAAATATTGIVNMTDDIYKHVKFSNGTDHFSYADPSKDPRSLIMKYTDAMQMSGEGASIAGPSMDVLAGSITGVGDAAAAAASGIDTASTAIVNATDEILNHVKFAGTLPPGMGYSGAAGGMPGYKGSPDPFAYGPGRSHDDPSWGDKITSTADAATAATKQVGDLVPLWNLSWTNIGLATTTTMNTTTDVVQLATDKILAYVLDAVQAVDDLYNRASALQNLHPHVTGLDSPGNPFNFKRYAAGGAYQAGDTVIVGDGGEPEYFTAGVSGFITPQSKAGGDVVHINIDARGATMNERQFRQVIEDALDERDRRFGQRSKGR